METPADRVRRARQVRGWSIRTAATKGGISNETWGKFERGDAPATDAIRRGVSAAFDWPGGWENQDVEPVLDPATVGDHIAHAVSTAEQAAAMFIANGDEISRLRDVVELQGRVIEELAAQTKLLMDELEKRRRDPGASGSAATT